MIIFRMSVRCDCMFRRNEMFNRLKVQTGVTDTCVVHWTLLWWCQWAPGLKLWHRHAHRHSCVIMKRCAEKEQSLARIWLCKGSLQQQLKGSIASFWCGGGMFASRWFGLPLSTRLAEQSAGLRKKLRQSKWRELENLLFSNEKKTTNPCCFMSLVSHNVKYS